MDLKFEKTEAHKVLGSLHRIVHMGNVRRGVGAPKPVHTVPNKSSISPPLCVSLMAGNNVFQT